MKFASEDLGQRKRVERDSSGKLRRLQAAVFKVPLPLAQRLVIVGERDTVGPIGDPIHGPQCGIVKGRFAQVVLQHNVRTRNPRRFTQHRLDVAGVVQHIHEQAYIKR